MTPEQEKHLGYILSEFEFRADTKYRKGQLEHGGNLFDMTTLDLLEHAIEEAIDQFVYLMSLRLKLLNIASRMENDIVQKDDSTRG